MAEEQAEALTSKETEMPKPYCIFYAGAMGTNHGISRINTMLTEMFGERVAAENSIISTDPPRPDRKRSIAETKKTVLSAGGRLVEIAHSSGLSQLMMSEEVLNELYPDGVPEEYYLNRDIVLIGPAGLFKGASNALRFLKRITWLSTTQGNSLLSRRLRHPVSGLESLLFLPPNNVNKQKLILALRKIYPEISQYIEELPNVAFLPEREYEEHLSEEQKTRVDEIDERLKTAIQQQDWEQARKLLLKRQSALANFIAEIYEGKYFTSGQEKQEVVSFIGPALLGLKLLASRILPGKELEGLNKLKDKGVRILFIVPEYDIIVKLDEIADFLGIERHNLSDHTVVLSPYTHSGFVASDAFAKGLKKALGLP